MAFAHFSMLKTGEHACAFVNDTPPCLHVGDWELIYSLSPMWAWEILSVISNLFSCQTREQRNIKLFGLHCGRRSPITPQSQLGITALFSLPSAPSSPPLLSTLSASLHCHLKLSQTAERRSFNKDLSTDTVDGSYYWDSCSGIMPPHETAT